VSRKPSELLFFVGGALDKQPIETWRRYEPFFPHLFHSTITPELLAALAQSKAPAIPGGAHLLALAAHLDSLPCTARLERCRHVPMTDPAYAETARSVSEATLSGSGCGFTASYPAVRAMPSSSAAVYLDHPGRGRFCPRARRSDKPAAEAGSRRFIISAAQVPASASCAVVFQMMAGGAAAITCRALSRKVNGR